MTAEPNKPGENYSEVQLDILREIGNIGAGNAATSMSSLLNRPINMSVPEVRLLDLEEATYVMGQPEDVVIGVLAKMYGDIEGVMMLIVSREFASLALGVLLGEDAAAVDWLHLSDMERSAIEELGNIMISSYCRSISMLLDLSMKTSVPTASVDMVGAIVSVAAIEMIALSNQVLFIADDYSDSEQVLASKMMVIPEAASLERLLRKLGV